MNLILHVQVADEVVGTCYDVLVLQQGQRVLRCVGVLGQFPVRVVVGGALRGLPESAEVLAHLAVVVDRTRGVDAQGCADGTAGVGIAVVLVHVLSRDVEGQVFVQERGGQVQREVGAAHLRGLDDTVRHVVAGSQSVGHVLGSTAQRDVVIGGDGRAENLVLPVGVGCAQGRGVQSVDARHQCAVGGAVQCIVLLLYGRHRDVAVVRHLGYGTALTLLGGDDDDTVRGAATVDGRCRGVLQHGEGLDVVGVDVGQDVAHARGRVAVDGQSVDDEQRVVRCIQRRTAADADLCTGAGRTAAGDDVHTGNLTHQHVGGIVRDALRHVVGVHGRHASGQVALLGVAVTDDYDVLQCLRIFHHRDNHVGGCGQFLGDETHVGKHQRRALGNAQLKVTVEIGNHGCASAFYGNFRANQRLAQIVLHQTFHLHLRH